MKGNRKGFYRYISSKRKLLLNGAGEMVTNDTEDTEDLNALFASTFISETGLQESQALETRGEV